MDMHSEVNDTISLKNHPESPRRTLRVRKVRENIGFLFQFTVLKYVLSANVFVGC